MFIETTYIDTDDRITGLNMEPNQKSALSDLMDIRHLAVESIRATEEFTQIDLEYESYRHLSNNERLDLNRRHQAMIERAEYTLVYKYYQGGE